MNPSGRHTEDVKVSTNSEKPSIYMKELKETPLSVLAHLFFSISA